MDWNKAVLKEYVNHFLPREIIGPVVIVFSLEGVISGLFSLYVPEEYATIGWALIFLLAVVTVAYWGTVDEEAVGELQDRIDELENTDSDK